MTIQEALDWKPAACYWISGNILIFLLLPLMGVAIPHNTSFGVVGLTGAALLILASGLHLAAPRVAAATSILATALLAVWAATSLLQILPRISDLGTSSTVILLLWVALALGLPLRAVVSAIRVLKKSAGTSTISLKKVAAGALIVLVSVGGWTGFILA